MMFRGKKRQFNLHLTYGFKTFMITEKKNKEKYCILEVLPSEQQQHFFVWFATYYIVIKHDI